MSNSTVIDFIRLLTVEIDLDDYNRICHKSCGDFYIGIELILQNGVSIEHRVQALEFAVKHGWIDCVKLLMEYNTDDPSILTQALAHTGISANTKILKLLYKNGADLQQHVPHLLTGGVHSGNTSFVKYLLDHIDLDYLNNLEYAPLLMATKRDNLSMIKLLYKNGADLNICNNAVLLLSAKNNCMRIVKYLLKKKININSYNLIGSDEEIKFGSNALVNSCSQGHFTMSKLLLKNGADYHICDYLALAKSICHNHLNIIKLLLKYGSDPNSIFTHTNVIEYLSKKKNTDLLQLLIKSGLNPGLDDDILLIECVKADNLKSVKLLLENGSNVNSQNGIVIQIATMAESYELIDLLLDYSYNYDSYVKNAYDYAVQNNLTFIEKIFLEKSNIRKYPIEIYKIVR